MPTWRPPTWWIPPKLWAPLRPLRLDRLLCLQYYRWGGSARQAQSRSPRGRPLRARPAQGPTLSPQRPRPLAQPPRFARWRTNLTRWCSGSGHPCLSKAAPPGMAPYVSGADPAHQAPPSGESQGMQPVGLWKQAGGRASPASVWPDFHPFRRKLSNWA